MLVQPAHPCSSFLQRYRCRSRELQIPHRSCPKPAWKRHTLPAGTVAVQRQPWLPATWAARPCPRAAVLIHPPAPAPRLLHLCPTGTVMLTFTQVFLDPLLRATGCPARPAQHAGRRLRLTAGKPGRTQTFSKHALTHGNTIPGSPRGQKPAMRPAPHLGAMNSL